MPTIEELGKIVKAKYSDYKDMDDREVGLKVQKKYPGVYDNFTDTKGGKGRPLLSRGPRDVAPVGGEKNLEEKTAEQRKFLTGEVAPQVLDETIKWAPLAVSLIPGVDVGSAVGVGVMAGAAALSSIGHDQLMNVLGIEHNTPGAQAAHALINVGLWTAPEAAMAGSLKVARSAKGPILGSEVGAADRALFEESKGIGPTSVADYRPSALGSVSKWFAGSPFGESASLKRGSEFLAGVEKQIDPLLEKISSDKSVLAGQSERETAAGKLLGETQRQFHQYASQKLYDPAYSAIDAAAGGKFTLQLPKPRLSDLGQIAETARKLAETNLDIAPEAGRIGNLVDRIMAMGGQETPEAVTTRWGEKIDVSQLKGYKPPIPAGAPKGDVRALGIRDVHDATSDLLKMARKAKDSNPKLAKLAGDTAAYLKENIGKEVSKLEGGDALWKNLQTADKYYAVGSRFFKDATIVRSMQTKPEAIVDQLSNLQDFASFKEVKRALIGYGNNRPAWNAVKRLVIEKQLRTAVLEGGGETGKAALDVFSAIPKVAQKLRQNPNTVRILAGDDPATASALQRLQTLSDVIQKSGENVSGKSSSKIGTYWLLHLSFGALVGVPTGLVSEGSAEQKIWKGFKAGAEATTGMMLVGAVPGAITRLMYSEKGANMFIRGMESSFGKIAKKITPSPHDINNIIQGVRIAWEDKGNKVTVNNDTELNPDAISGEDQ